MSLEQQITALVEASNNLTGSVNGKISQIDQRMTDAEAEFDEWRNQKDVVGEPGWDGTMRMNVFQGKVIATGGVQGVGGTGHFSGKIADLGTTDQVYLHFKTPMNVNNHQEMFWFNVRGYSYGTVAIIDETIVGYCYSPGRQIRNKASFGELLPDSYADSSGNVILRIKLTNAYFSTVRIDSMQVGTALYPVGSLDVKVSLNEAVEF